MTRRVVIADAGPLIALARIEAHHLLQMMALSTRVLMRVKPAPFNWQANGTRPVTQYRAGRLEAKSRGLALIGSAAVIGLAKTEGLVPAARPLLDKMVASGYFIGPSIVSVVLADVGE